MLTLLGSLFGPILTILGKIFGLVSNVETAKYQAESTETVAEVESMAAVDIKWWFVAAMIPFFAIPVGIWEWKAIVYDKIWMAGTTATDPLLGALGIMANIIVSGIFLHSLVDLSKR